MSPLTRTVVARLALGASSVALSIALVTHPSRAADPPPLPALDEATIAVVTTKVASGPATIRRFTMSTSRELDFPKNKTTRMEVKTEHVLLESGLWGTSSEASVSGALSSSGLSTSLQLCGLVELLQASRSRQENAMTLALPIGKLFVPLGLVDTQDIEGSRRVSSFASDEPSLCSPRPGSRFEYQVTTDVVAGSARASPSRRVMCTVADRLEALDDRVRGAGDLYLPVTCENASAPHQVTHLAYLPTYRYYVVLDASDGGLRESHVLSVD